MTNAEKVKTLMDSWDCVEFYCKHHYCEDWDCPIVQIKSERDCQELLAEWMRQEAKEDE